MRKYMMVLPILCMSVVQMMAEEISKDSVRLQEVVVTGVRSQEDVRQLPQTLTIVDRATLTAHQRPNVLQTLMEQVPGLLVTSRGVMGYGVSTGASGNMMMRGLSSSAGQMMVLIDGHPQYQGVFGHSIADSYHTMLAERVEVLRGPASMLYGSNAMAGVVNIVTRKPVHDGTHTSINLSAGSYGTAQAEAMSQSRVGKFTSTVGAQYGRSDNHRPNMGFQQYGGMVKLGYELNDHWTLVGDMNMTHFLASNPGTLKEPKEQNDQYITRGEASLRAEYKYHYVTGAFSAYDNSGRHKVNDGYSANGGKPQTDLFRSRDAVEGLSWYQTVRIPGLKDDFAATVTTGIDYQHIYGRAWYSDRKTGATVTTKKRLMQSAHTHAEEWAGYVQWRQQLGGLFTLDAGLRYDHHSVAGGEWVPQVGLVRHIGTGQMKAMVSKGFRNPTNKEMFLYGTANHDSLRAERLMNYELSWRDALLDGRLTYGVTAFYLRGDNMIQTVAGKNVNTGEFENLGVELETAWNVNSHWHVNANYSYLHMQQDIVAAPRHKAFLGANMHYGQWAMTGGLQYLGGMLTSIGGQEEDATLLSLTISYKPCRPVMLYVRGENLLAQRYELNAGYPMPKATMMAGVRVEF